MGGAVTGRRAALILMGLGAAASLSAQRPAEAAESSLLPPGAGSLGELSARLNRAPRRRDFKTVPMILDHPDLWDHTALSELIAYRGGPRQVLDNTEIAGPWLNTMRNAMNTQIWSFRHPDFIVVSATHGSAHLALFEPAMWDKYQFAKLAGGKVQTNTFLSQPIAGAADPGRYEDVDGAYSPYGATIATLQRRGAVFLACHNAIWEIAGKLIASGVNPDGLAHGALASDLTNNLAPGVVLTPGVAGVLVELQQAGFHYAA
jgi:hypothetical protein